MRPTFAALLLLFALTSAAAEPWALWKSPIWKSAYRENLSEEEKIAGLARLWSEVKYNFANFDITETKNPGLDWDAQFLATIPRVRATKSTAEYYRVLQELLARLHDGHTYVWPPREVQKQSYVWTAVDTKLVEGKVLITGVRDPALDVAAGEEITAIDGIPVMEYAATRIKPYVFSSTPQDFDWRVYGQFLLMGDLDKPVRVTLRGARGTRGVSLPRPATPPAAARRPLTEFSVLEGNVGYLALNSFNDEKLRAEYDALWPQIAATSALIIDIRRNGGGNSSNGWYVLSTLTAEPFKSARWKTRRYLPSRRAWNEPEEWDEHEAEDIAPDGKRHYSKPVAVLISERTWSAAEDFAIAFDAMERGPLVGVATGGSTGQPLLIDLPGGGIAGICTKRDQYPDGRDFVGVGVMPDIPVAPAIDDIVKGTDRTLARAMEAVQGRTR
jgi:carboxyl-terminal processing protease